MRSDGFLKIVLRQRETGAVFKACTRSLELQPADGQQPPFPPLLFSFNAQTNQTYMLFFVFFLY